MQKLRELMLRLRWPGTENYLCVGRWCGEPILRWWVGVLHVLGAVGAGGDWLLIWAGDRSYIFGWGIGLAAAVEAAGLHGGDWLGVLHEGVPDEGGAEVFCHEGR